MGGFIDGIIARFRKPTLRELCVQVYSEEFGEDFGREFGEMYDDVNRGTPIGGFHETMAFVDMVERVKREHAGEWRKR